MIGTGIKKGHLTNYQVGSNFSKEVYRNLKWDKYVPVKAKQRIFKLAVLFWRAEGLRSARFVLNYCSTSSPILMMQAKCSPQRLVVSRETTRRHVQKGEFFIATAVSILDPTDWSLIYRLPHSFFYWVGLSICSNSDLTSEAVKLFRPLVRNAFWMLIGGREVYTCTRTDKHRNRIDIHQWSEWDSNPCSRR
jgi:hypothetical protein